MQCCTQPARQNAVFLVKSLLEKSTKVPGSGGVAGAARQVTRLGLGPTQVRHFLSRESPSCETRGYDLSYGWARKTAGATRIRVLLTRAGGTPMAAMASRLRCANNFVPTSWVVKRPGLASFHNRRLGLPRCSGCVLGAAWALRTRE